jgi:rhamnogalacturonan acetylesterase
MKRNPLAASLIIASALVLMALAQPRRPTLYLIGDSTVKNSSGNGEGGMWGWGHFIAPHFDTTRLQVENHAIGGRSSRTFLAEGRWDRIMATLNPGDFVMMQFGHNDAGPVNDTIRARGSIKGIGIETEEIDNLITKKHEIVHSYGWYMQKYITDAQAKGAVPIVLSLVPRNVWKNGKVVRATGSYVTWAADVAKKQGAYFIDLNERVAAKYDALGDSATLQTTYFVNDHTHTNAAGARLNAATVMEGVAQLKNCPLNRYRTAKPSR